MQGVTREERSAELMHNVTLLTTNVPRPVQQGIAAVLRISIDAVNNGLPEAETHARLLALWEAMPPRRARRVARCLDLIIGWMEESWGAAAPTAA